MQYLQLWHSPFYAAIKVVAQYRKCGKIFYENCIKNCRSLGFRKNPFLSLSLCCVTKKN